jgi:hypothetical protein
MVRMTVTALAVTGVLSLGAAGDALAQKPNPCAAKNPCAAQATKNPCAAKNPCATKK